MSLQETLEDLKKQRDEALEREAGEAPEEEVIEEEEKVEEAPQEPEEERPEVKEGKAEEPDNSAFARLRRESAANKKRAEDAEAREASAREETKKQETEQEANPLAHELEQVLTEHRTRLAEREFQTLEMQFKVNNPDYDVVSKQYAEALFGSIKVQNPRMSPMDIAERTKQTLLQQAGEYVRSGYNPIEEMYHNAKELGFTAKPAQKDAEKEIKPDMVKVAENRKRNAGTAGASGESKSGVTREYVSQNGITNAEWMKLPASEKKRLMFG